MGHARQGHLDAIRLEDRLEPQALCEDVQSPHRTWNHSVRIVQCLAMRMLILLLKLEVGLLHLIHLLPHHLHFLHLLGDCEVRG
jgi:hypothetical protein